MIFIIFVLRKNLDNLKLALGIYGEESIEHILFLFISFSYSVLSLKVNLRFAIQNYSAFFLSYWSGAIFHCYRELPLLKSSLILIGNYLIHNFREFLESTQRLNQSQCVSEVVLEFMSSFLQGQSSVLSTLSCFSYMWEELLISNHR